MNQFIQERQDNARYLATKMDNSYKVQQEKHGTSSWFGFSLLIEDPELNRTTIVNQLTQHGIICRPIVSGNFLRNEVVHHLNYRIAGQQTQANHIHDHGFFIGNHPFSLRQEIDRMVNVLTPQRHSEQCD